MAPGNADTLERLTNPESRPPARLRDLPPANDDPLLPEGATLDVAVLYSVIRSAKRGVSAGLSGMRAEHLKPLLEAEESMDALGQVASRLALGLVPDSVGRALALGRLTALQKPGRPDVRGIATGDVLRRLVARTLAQQLGEELDRASEPYQFALRTRAGTDAAAHLRRALTDLDRDATIMALDGVGAYDHILRAELFRGLQAHPELALLVPYARLFYGGQSRFLWFDSDGEPHEIHQGEGVEQGDALSPAFFALALHRALQEADSHL